ncbi:hypothetical protein ACTFIV_005208 [Dictyostelium citrinum]
MSTTNNNQDASSISRSASIKSDHSKERLDSLEEKFDKFFSLVNRFMKQPINSSGNYSVPASKRESDDSDTEDEDREERTDTDSVPTDYQLSDTLLDQYKTLINNQGLLIEEECILKKSEISEMNKVFSFPSNFQVNVAPFGTSEGITAYSNLKNNDADIFVVEKRINDTLKPLFLMFNMTTHDSTNVDLELIRYLAESAIILTVNAQASLGRVRRNNISKEIYGSEVLQPIKIKDTPKMFDETETERVRKLAKSIRKNNEVKQSLLKLNSQSKSTFKKSGGYNTNGNSSNSKPSSGSSGRSNNFNGSAGSVASGSNTSKSASTDFRRTRKGPKSECISKEVQVLLVEDAIEQVPPTQYSKLVFYSNVFTVPKPGTNILRPVLDLKSIILLSQSNHLPSMVKQGYYMVKLDIKKAYLHVLVDPHYRDLFRFVWNGVHYRWKTMPFGLSTAPRIFTMLLRPVLRMLRELNISVIAYLDDLLIVGSTKEECLSNLNKTMELLVKLGFKLNLEKSVLEPTQSITFLGLQIDSISMQLLVPKEKKKSVIKEIRNFLKLDSCTPRKLAGLKGKLIALKDAVIPFRLYTRRTNKFHCQCLSLSNGDWDQSFVIPQDVKSEISNWLTLLTQWNGKEISLFPSYDYVLTTDASESGAGHQDMVIPVVNDPVEHVIKSSRDARSVNGLSNTMSGSQQLQTEDSNRQHNNPFVNQSPRWSNPRFISPLRTTLEAVSQEESQLDWRAHSRILQCQSRPPQPSCRVESQVIQDSQELQLETQEGSVQSHSTSVRSNSDGSVCISPQPSNDQLLHIQNECTPTRLESVEAVSKDQLIEFDEGFYNTDIPGMEISNMVSDDSKSSSSSSSSSVSSSSGYIPRSIVQRVNRVNTYSDSTTMEVGDYSTFQSHVKSIINTQKPGTTELFKSSWQPSTLKVYDSNYSRFFSFCMKNSLDPSDISLVVFMNYLTYLFNLKPPLAYSTINSHRSMLNHLLSLKNQTDISHDPFITRIMTGIHKLRPASAKYNEIWDANLVFRYLSTINIYPRFTFSALLHKTLVLCKMFGLARSSDLVKWSFKALKVTTDSIKGPVINAKEQRNTKNADISILELTSLEDANLSVCPVRHLATYLRSSSKKRTSKSGDSVFIQADGTPLQVDDINKVVISTLSKSGIDVTKFKSHSTRSAMASLLLSNNIPFHVVKKMGRWKSNDTVDTFYDKKIIGEKSGGFLNTVVQLS